MRAWGIVVVGFGLIAACGSSYTETTDRPDAGGQTGGQGGACYPNGTCDKSLLCIANVCVASGGSSSGSTSSSTSSGSTNDGGTVTTEGGTTSGGNPGACPHEVLEVNPQGIGCGFPVLCNPSQVCCQTTQSDWECLPSCSGNVVACDTPNDCSGLCCFSVVQNQPQCPAITINRSACSTDACAGADVQACNDSVHCPSGTKCEEATIVLNGTNKSIGAKICVSTSQ